MARFAAGLVVGIVLGGAAGAGATYVLFKREPQIAATQPPPEPTTPATPRKKGKRVRNPARPGEPEPVEPTEPVDESIVLTAADLRMSSEGDALRAEATNLDLGAEGGPRDLSQDEIDGAIGRHGSAIIGCITRARGAAPVTGRVTAGMVVGADGRVVKSRIEAPAYLLAHGLASCARRELEAVKFPAAGKQTVVTVPFDID